MNMERARHLNVWHDASTLANHGHIVITANKIYDKPVFLRNDEYKIKSGKTMSVQKEIEKPIVYIVAGCHANDDQLAYVETRMQCIEQLSVQLETSIGIKFTDTLRLFKGDSPAVQFEVGNQKGGYYFCGACGIHATRVPYEHPQAVVIAGKFGYFKSIRKTSKPFENLTKQQLEEELVSRGEYYLDNKKKPELSEMLTDNLQGYQRVPALLYQQPTAKLGDLNLDKYECYYVNHCMMSPSI